MTRKRLSPLLYTVVTTQIRLSRLLYTVVTTRIWLSRLLSIVERREKVKVQPICIRKNSKIIRVRSITPLLEEEGWGLPLEVVSLTAEPGSRAGVRSLDLLTRR